MNRGNQNSQLFNKKTDYSFGINGSLRYVRWLMRPLGIWPLVSSNSSNFEKIVSKFVRPVAMMFMFLIIIPMFAEVVSQRGDRSEIIALMAPIVYHLTTTFKHFFMILRVDLIKHCVQHMAADWQRIDNTNDRDIMVKNIQSAHTLGLVCTSFIYAGSAFYNVIMPLCAGSTINESNETVRPLKYTGADLFFDVQASYIYEIVFCSFYISAISAVTVGMAVLNLTLLFVRHTCGQMQIIVSRLESLVDSEVKVAPNTREKPVTYIIKNHARLIKFARDIEKALKEICLLEVMNATLLICLLEYYFLIELSNNNRMAIFTYVTMLLSVSFNLFLYCQIGEVLKEECQTIGQTAYMIEWYNLPKKTSLHLIMIMSISAEPPSITAGGMMEVSRVSFANIMKTSFAYFNMLRTVA